MGAACECVIVPAFGGLCIFFYKERGKVMRLRMSVLLLATFCCILIVFTSSGAGAAGKEKRSKKSDSGIAEKQNNQSSKIQMIGGYLERRGISTYKSKTEGKHHLISFKLGDKATNQAVDFFVLMLLDSNIMLVECRGIADVPKDPKKVAKLLQVVNDLNRTRTIGKYLVDNERKTVRFTHYMTVADGISYKDFTGTLDIMGHSVFQDLSKLKSM
jgi:hypothetical protein